MGKWLLALDADRGEVQGFDLSNQRTREIGPSRLAPVAVGRYGLFFPGEAEAFEDWNGDGDQTDVILRIWDSSNGRIRDTEEATFWAQGIGPEAALLLALESEEHQDANLDGDEHDAFFRRLDLRTGRTEPLALAVYGHTPSAHGRALVFVHEQGQGADLNGDVDLFDVVLHVVEQP